MSDDTIDLESLIGLRTLDGRGEFVTRREYSYGDDDSARVLVFRLDGVLYWFQEDPSDGYRSDLGVARICTPDEIPPGAFVEFSPMAVEVRMQTQAPSDSYRDGDRILYGINEATGLAVFAVGTENINDYYPSFIGMWWPEGDTPDWLRGVSP